MPRTTDINVAIARWRERREIIWGEMRWLERNAMIESEIAQKVWKKTWGGSAETWKKTWGGSQKVWKKTWDSNVGGTLAEINRRKAVNTNRRIALAFQLEEADRNLQMLEGIRARQR